MSHLLRRGKIRIEATSRCQLACPSCPTASGATRRALGKGYLQADAFRNLIERNRWVRWVELSNYGEVFLNPELVEIMQSACSRGALVKRCVKHVRRRSSLQTYPLSSRPQT